MSTSPVVSSSAAGADCVGREELAALISAEVAALAMAALSLLAALAATGGAGRGMRLEMGWLSPKSQLSCSDSGARLSSAFCAI